MIFCGVFGLISCVLDYGIAVLLGKGNIVCLFASVVVCSIPIQDCK